MALSIESIFKPINDFFLEKYKTDSASPIIFRFDKFGSAISDQDYIETDSPEDIGLAQEMLSDLVNFVPVLDTDGVNVFFGSNLIESEYHTILTSSLPLVDPLDLHKEEIINSFNKIKSEANLKWEKLSIVRGGGIMDTYRASFASPSNWYERNNNEFWTTKSFQIEESLSTSPIDQNKNQLWKLKLNDEQLKEILPSLKTTKTIQPIELRKDAIRMTSGVTRTGANIKVHDHRKKSPVQVRDNRIRPHIIVHDHRRPQITVQDHRTSDLKDSFPVRQNLIKNLHRLDLINRLGVLHYIREKAPTKPSNTNSLNISFRYCRVIINRLWLSNSLINSKSWFIPGTVKGEVSALGSEFNLSHLPISFLAIKNLEIEADWSNVDILTSKDATNFGPFEISSSIIDKKLSHDGIQIIGWFLQKMPDLPPNNPPE